MAMVQAAAGNLTPAERGILAGINIGASSFSLIGSGFIVLCYLLFKELHKLSFNLVFFLALSLAPRVVLHRLVVITTELPILVVKVEIAMAKSYVIDALCNVVSASPAKAAAAIVLQRIVKVIVELMRNHETPESLVILASASDLLFRATDGMFVDSKACIIPQLEELFSRILFEDHGAALHFDYSSFKLLFDQISDMDLREYVVCSFFGLSLVGGEVME